MSVFAPLGYVVLLLAMLKLVGILNLSWFWILSPFLMPFMVIGTAVLVVMLFAPVSFVKALQHRIRDGGTGPSK